MTPSNPRSKNAFPLNEEAWQLLNDTASAVSYNLSNNTVYELRLHLRTPGIFALYKADVPAPGLPMLDGFLKFVAFRQATDQVAQKRPDLTNDLLWQWNLALCEAGRWIDFPIPIRQESLNNGITIYDCSVGLPLTPEGDVLYPAGAFFANGGNLTTYPSEEKGPADQIALRRRSVEPFYRPVELTVKKLDTQSGSTKALDNRIYYALTREYAFYLRGDSDGVRQLLDFAIQHDIGIGKKTTLGYGRIAQFEIQPTNRYATLGHDIGLPGSHHTALLKNVPYQELQRRSIRSGDFGLVKKLEGGQWTDILMSDEWDQNERLFGAREFSLTSPIETFDCYFPPYWRREGRTQVLRYGTLLVPR
ncbi:MAG TPA: hypothetical protein ENN99_04320 [Chloroflexi bacterium]|nr:hypothetical protein [Chloroflexota bacterium]